jgi:hypothetical protein
MVRSAKSTMQLTGVLLLAGLAAAAHRYRADAMASAASKYKAGDMTADKGTKVTSLPRKKVMAAAAHRYRADVMTADEGTKVTLKKQKSWLLLPTGTELTSWPPLPLSTESWRHDCAAQGTKFTSWPPWLNISGKKNTKVMADTKLTSWTRLHPGTWTPSPKGTQL